MHFVNIKSNLPKVFLLSCCSAQRVPSGKSHIFRGWEWISSILFSGKSVKSPISLVLLTRKTKLQEVTGRRGLPVMNHQPFLRDRSIFNTVDWLLSQTAPPRKCGTLQCINFLRSMLRPRKAFHPPGVSSGNESLGLWGRLHFFNRTRGTSDEGRTMRSRLAPSKEKPQIKKIPKCKLWVGLRRWGVILASNLCRILVERFLWSPGNPKQFS